jgi:hypothetical protein
VVRSQMQIVVAAAAVVAVAATGCLHTLLLPQQ